MIVEYFRFSLRNISRRRLRSWLTLIGIVIGITAVVALVGLGQGLQTAIMSQFDLLGTDVLTIQAQGGFGPPGFAVSNPLTKDTLAGIRRINGVKLAGGRILNNGKLEFNSRVAFGYAASIPEGEGRTLFLDKTGLEAQEGRLLREGERGKVMLGNNLGSADMDAFFGKNLEVGSRILIDDHQYLVIGILDKIGNFLFDNMIIMNEDDMRDQFKRDDEYDMILAQVENTDEIERVQADIERFLRKERNVRIGEEDFSVETPASALDDVNAILTGVQIFVYVIAAISIIVGGFGIMNTMFTSVLERTRDIGIMKSIGARNSNIFGLFFVESGLIGSVGGIIGASLGALLAIGLASLGAKFLGEGLIQADISIWLFFGSITGSFLLGSFFGIIPAIQAAKMRPVDALRHKK